VSLQRRELIVMFVSFVVVGARKAGTLPTPHRSAGDCCSGDKQINGQGSARSGRFCEGSSAGSGTETGVERGRNWRARNSGRKTTPGHPRAVQKTHKAGGTWWGFRSPPNFKAGGCPSGQLNVSKQFETGGVFRGLRRVEVRANGRIVGNPRK